MPIEYRIHPAARIVVARGHGVVADQDVFGYQREAWARAEVRGFNELVDMTDVERIEVPTEARMRELAALSASMDPPETSSKMAIVASDRLAIGLSQMYGARRDFHEGSTKEVRVFTTRAAALEWLEVAEGELVGGDVGKR